MYEEKCSIAWREAHGERQELPVGYGWSHP